MDSGWPQFYVDPFQLWNHKSQPSKDFLDGSAVDSSPSSISREARKLGNGRDDTLQKLGQSTAPASTNLKNRCPEEEQTVDTGADFRFARAQKAADCGYREADEVQARSRSNYIGTIGPSNNARRRKDDKAEKTKRYRERNRVAAAKFRAKRKNVVGDLEEAFRATQATNKFLKSQLIALRDELSTMRTLALLHDTHDNTCTCEGIRQYNHKKAMELTRNCFDARLVSTVDGGLQPQDQDYFDETTTTLSALEGLPAEWDPDWFQ